MQSTEIESREKTFITNFTKFFLRNSRLTILLIPLLFLFGFDAYQNLRREGFPALEIPTVLINIPYFVNDKTIVDQDVTVKFENLIKQIDGVKSFISTTSENFSSIIVTFEDGTSSLEGQKLIQQKYDVNPFLKDIKPNITAVKVTSRDNKSDLIFSIANESVDVETLQEKADLLSKEIQKLPEVAESYVIKQFEQKVNPLNNQITKVRDTFSKFVQKNENDEFEVYESVNIGVVKANENIGTIELSNAVRNKVDKLAKDIDSPFYNYKFNFNGDFADSLKSQLSLLESNALSAILIILVVLFFLINWRSSLLLAAFFPLTLGGIFIVLNAIGYSLNTITLFALILVLGLFVDDGIIIVEAVDYYKKQGYKSFKAVLKAIDSIGVADLLGTLTTVLVFVPLIFITGPLGEFIRQLPVTVIISLTVSLLVALSILSFLSGVFLKDKKPPKQQASQNLFTKIEQMTLSIGNKLSKFVATYLQSKTYTSFVIVLSLLLIGLGSFFASRLKFNIFPPAKDSNNMIINIQFKNDQNIDEIIKISEKIDEIIINALAKYLKDYSYIRANKSSALLNINLVDLANRDVTSVKLASDLTNYLSEIENISVSINTAIAGPPEDPRPFKMQIFADDDQVLDVLSSDLTNFLIENITLMDTSIREVSLNNSDTIQKKNGNRYLQVEVGFEEGSTTATINELKNKIENLWIPLVIDKYNEFKLTEDNFEFDSGFASANAESFASLQGAFLISLFVMYLLLMIQFNSFTQPLLILLAVPFSFMLLFPGLYFTNNDLSFFVTLGLTALIGIVVNNSIVLIDYTNQLREAGLGIRDSIVEAIKVRFRPILSTTITSIAGLIPLAVSEPLWEPLAVTLIFGLLSSVVLIIFAYPAYYVIIEKIRSVVKSKLKKIYKIFI